MSLEWKWFVRLVMGGRGVTRGDNDSPLKYMRYYCFWKYVHFSVSQSRTHAHTQHGVYRQTPIETHMCKQAERTHTQRRYNMINGGVSLTLINYNQIKDFISFISFGHTVNQRSVRWACRDSLLSPTFHNCRTFEINFNKVWKRKLDIRGGK